MRADLKKILEEELDYDEIQEEDPEMENFVALKDWVNSIQEPQYEKDNILLSEGINKIHEALYCLEEKGEIFLQESNEQINEAFYLFDQLTDLNYSALYAVLGSDVLYSWEESYRKLPHIVDQELKTVIKNYRKGLNELMDFFKL